LLGGGEGVLDTAAGSLAIERARPFSRGWLVRFHGLEDRNAVEDLAGRYLLAERATLAEPGEDEVWYHHLLGLTVRTVAGVEVGPVREVYEASPADLIEVEAAGGRLILIPATRRIVKRIDVAEGIVEIEPPAGLLDL
jgi:16S rRNA processing protein RimM